MVSAARSAFGTAPDGSTVEKVVIAGGGLTAAVMSWGAALTDLRLAGHGSPLILGFGAFGHYLDHSPYFGAIVGRFANRIAGGRFVIDGVTHRTDRDFLGRHTLHGGARGTHRRNWTVIALDADAVSLTLADNDGEMGFPGNCQLAVTYRLGGAGVLRVEMDATTDRPTPLNLASHAYFNLDGADTILDHELRIDAEHYLPVDAELIPTGEIRTVAGTPFDFRRPRPIRHAAADGGQFVYDHNFCLSAARTGLREVARLASIRSGVAMAVATTEPGLQFYAGHAVATPVPGLTGRPYGACSGLCLEAQAWPDAPNRPEFPDAILRPGERYRQETEYRFAAAG
ncbi:MAG: aldose 1-epimerase [Alphaproteobacteria bacterium]|nr:MAG: aldose 1-epimerase [Alphaproteobacteria bacterium]